jgi:CRP/FNR family cyclic AMP-dependent transcriptional regulator
MAFWKRPQEAPDSLAGVAYFDGITPPDLARVAELCTEVEVPAGTVIIDQGATGLDCFVIVEGRTNVYIGGEYVNTNGPGSIIGEMALVDHRPRSATVLAETELKALRFDARRFRTLLSEMPKAEDRVMALLNSRLKLNG